MYGLAGSSAARAAVNAAEDAVNAAKRGERRAEDALFKLERLESRLEQLTVVNRALWSLLLEETSLTDSDLIQRVRAINLADGTDGEVRANSPKCPECSRPVSPKQERCLYCGQTASGVDVFGIPIWSAR